MVMLVGASIGWTAALCAIVANGSYGVPIKSDTCRRLDISPLVFQTYKTIMCLLFSFAVVPAMGIPITFSPWGIVSGIFWVPGGVATVMAVQLLGLSMAVAITNSLVALVSFTWGIFIFQETVKSKSLACLGVLMMITGFSGMSFCSSQGKKNPGYGTEPSVKYQEPLLDTKRDKIAEAKKLDEEASLDDTCSETDSIDSETSGSDTSEKSSYPLYSSESSNPNVRNRNRSLLDLSDLKFTTEDISATKIRRDLSAVQASKVRIFGREVSRFKAGVTIAAMGGVWGGSVMIPMKFCDHDTSGLGFLVSFSCGSTLVTMALWCFLFIYEMSSRGSISSTYKAMPSFHIKEMWRPGGLAGLLWSTGNMCAILAVELLGAGVGYCAVQASMLVGGLWGILYYGEIKSGPLIAKWFFAALTTMSGIGLLAHVHEE